jgi:hypothetical protein
MVGPIHLRKKAGSGPESPVQERQMKRTVSFRQELIVAAATAVAGLFMVVMTWSGFYAVAKDHPAVHLFLLGQSLLFLAVGLLISVQWRRSWVRSMEQLWQNHSDHDVAE